MLPQANNIVVLSLNDERMNDMANVTWPGKVNYSTKHGYSTAYYSTTLDKSRPTSWSKIRAVKETFKLGADWVWWSDTDSCVMCSKHKLESIIEMGGDKDFLVTADLNGMNLGVFLIRNCDWAYKFLDNVYAQTDLIENNVCYEQTAARRIFDTSPADMAHVCLLPQSAMNSYLIPMTYKPGDFVLHLAGSVPNKTKLLSQYLRSAT